MACLRMKANKLTIMLQNLVHKTATQKPKILCHGCPIAVNSNVKYLALWIDDNLNFDIHLKFVDRKIAYAMGILNKLKCYFPNKILLQLYHVLICLHLLHAISTWGSTYKSYLHNISIFQRKAVNANPSHMNLKVLKLN